jgi:hypothetical protein
MTNKQLKIGGTIAAAIAIALLLWILLGKECNPSPKVVAPIDSIIYWRNMAGKIVASQQGAKEQFELRYKHLEDSLAKVYKTKVKWLQEYIIARTSGTSDLPAVDNSKQYEYAQVIVHGDTCPPAIQRMRQRFHNNYYDALIQIGDSSYMRLRSVDTITVLWKKVKQGNLFHRKTLLQLDISSANPDTKIEGLKTYKTPPIKPKRVGIGMQAGYEFDGKRFRPYFGLGFSYNLIRI